MEKKTKIITICSAAIAVVAVAAFIILIFINKHGINLPANSPESNSINGISFESMGENFILSSNKRKRLKNKFGNDVLESWSPVIFDEFSENFFKIYLEDIFKISKKLKDIELKEKSGKNSIKIKYPYVQKNTKIFKEIHLTFSNLTKTPLIFKISSYEHESFLNNLNKKFSNPETINFNDTDYFFWKKDNSVMISQIKNDRYDKPYLAIVIYYTENIKNFFTSINNGNHKNIENPF